MQDSESKFKKKAKKYKRKSKKYKHKLRSLSLKLDEVLKQVETLKAGLNCPICVEFYCLPYSLSCGHAFCLDCLKSWFCANDDQQARSSFSCPICRERVVNKPTHNLTLDQQIKVIMEKFPSDDKKSFDERYFKMKKILKDSEKSNCKPENDTWLGIRFPRGKLADEEDHVGRCMSCLWEIVGDRCVNCGAVYSEVSDDEDAEYVDLDLDMGDNENRYLDTDEDFSDQHSFGADYSDDEENLDNNSSDSSRESPALKNRNILVIDEASEDESELDYDYDN